MKKVNIVVAICLLAVMTLPACGIFREKQTKEEIALGNTYLYYINADKTGIEKESCSIEQENPGKAVEDMLKQLAKNSTDVKYNPAIPESVKVLNYTIADGGELQLDLSASYNDLKVNEKALSKAAIVDTLVQIKGVDSVQFLIEGAPMTDSAGNVTGALNADSFVQNVGSTLSSYQTVTLTLYFASEQGDALKKETADVKYSTNVAMEKLIIEQLMNGPGKMGNYRVLNPEAIILGATIRDGICYVNFDGEFLNNAYDVKPEVTIYALVNSLIDGTTATSVQISVNGETNVTYMDAVDLSQPLKKNADLIEGEGGK